MKKFLAVLLSLCLLCAIAAPAFGESGYTLLKAFFTAEDYRNLGNPMVVDGDWTDKKLGVIFDLDNQKVVIGGTNASYSKEMSIWTNVELADSLLTLYKLCDGWEAVVETVDTGYEFGIIIILNEENTYITSKSDADAFCQALLNWLSK